MQRSKLFTLVGALLVAAMLLAACPAPARPAAETAGNPRPEEAC